jgi:hypothetical protein
MCETISFPANLFRIVYLDTPTHKLLYFLIHHLVADALSVNIIASDYFHFYGTLTSGRSVDLPAKSTPLLGFCEASYQFWYARATEEAAYWRSVGFDRRHTLLNDEVLGRPENDEGNTAVVMETLPVEEWALRTLHKETGWSPAEIILGAIARAYAAWTTSGALHIALVMHGRESFVAQVDLSRTVGWISETVPLLLDGNLRRNELLNECRRQLRHAAWRGKSYGVLRHLTLEPSLRDACPPQISLNLKLSRMPLLSPDSLFLQEPEFNLQYRELCSTQRAFFLSGGVFADGAGRLCLSWDFSRALFDQNEIGKFARLCAENAACLIQLGGDN